MRDDVSGVSCTHLKCGVWMSDCAATELGLLQKHRNASPQHLTYEMASPNTKPGGVTFHHDVQFERQTTPKDYRKDYRIMTTDIFEEFAAEAITDAMLVEVAGLFSKHYGT